MAETDVFYEFGREPGFSCLVYSPDSSHMLHMGIHASVYTYTPSEPNQVLHGYLLHFVGSKFLRTKVCDIYPLAERAFNLPNMTFF